MLTWTHLHADRHTDPLPSAPTNYRTVPAARRWRTNSTPSRSSSSLVHLAGHPAGRKRPMLEAHLKTLCTQQVIRASATACAQLTLGVLGDVATACDSATLHPSIVGPQAVEYGGHGSTDRRPPKVQTKCKHAPRHSTTSANRAKAKSSAIRPNSTTRRHSTTLPKWAHNPKVAGSNPAPRYVLCLRTSETDVSGHRRQLSLPLIGW